MTLFDASIDGIPLEIETLDDQFEVSISRHEFPYKEGALLENLGQKARTVSIRCYFWDDGSHQTYNRHIELVNSLQAAGLSELIHPQYGTIKGMVERLSVRADDRELTSEVDLTFVENLRQEVSEVEYEDVVVAADQALIDIQDELMDLLSADALNELGAEASALLGVELDPELAIPEHYSQASKKARTWLKKIDAAVSAFEADLTGVTQPANSLIATINYGTRLPGRVIGSIARMLDRHVALYSAVDTAPSRFIRNLTTAADVLISTGQIAPELQKHLRVALAAQGAQAIARYYAVDEQERQLLRRLEKQPAFDVQGRYLNPETPAPVYSANELEASLYSIRATIQQAIDGDDCRSITSLKSLARILVEHVNIIKLEREKIIAVTLDNPMPLHLICLRYGLDYHYAERITTINTIPRPNFTGDSLQIYIGGGQ